MKKIHIQCGCIAIILWSINFFIVEKAVNMMNPFVFTFCRMVFAVPIMFFLRPKHSIKLMVVLTLCWNIGNFNLVGLALKEGVLPSSISIIQQLNVFTIVFLGSLYFREKLMMHDICYIFSSIFGLVIFFLPDIFLLRFDFGSVLILCSCVFWAIGMSIIRKYQVDSSLNTVIWLAGLAAFAQVPITIFLVPKNDFAITFSGIILAAISFVTSTVFANILWLKASKKLKGNELSMLLLLMPIIVVSLDAILFDRYVSYYELLGGVIIFFSIFFKLFYFKRKRFYNENIR